MDLYDMREDEYLSYDQIIEMDVELDYLVDASIFIGQVKHLEFDLIRNQSH